MLEQNRLWLQASNQKMMDAYRKQPDREPCAEYGDLRFFDMSHEGKLGICDEDYVTPKFYERQNENLKSLDKKKPLEGEKRFVIVSGTDGGLLLNHVVSNNLIKHLVIIEEDVESFSHSLQVTDWPALFKDFEERGGTVFFNIGPMTLNVKQRLYNHFNDIGPHNASTIHVDLDNGKMSGPNVKTIVSCLQDVINSLGFFDDERVGLAHTVDKLTNRARFLERPRAPWIEKPAMVCGNGSSLEKALPQIRKHREKMILIACGSTIGTFYRNDITPDFYIEQERPKVTSNVTKVTTTPEFRKNVTAITLNVTHPQTDGMFRETVHVLKSNDLGAMVAKKFLPDHHVAMFVNPLVANCGLSVAIHLGFKEIYLAGVDCAFSADGASHAKGVDERYTRELPENAVPIKGNLRETVHTIPLFFDSLKSLSLAIRNAPKGAKFYNMSDGGYVVGAKPTKKFIPKHTPKISIDEILEPFTPPVHIPHRDELRRSFLSMFSKLRGKIDSIPNRISGRDEAFFYIDEVYSELQTLKEYARQFWTMVKGTFSTHLVFLHGCAERDLDAFDRSSTIFKDLAQAVHLKLKEDFYLPSMWEGTERLPKNVND